MIGAVLVAASVWMMGAMVAPAAFGRSDIGRATAAARVHQPQRWASFAARFRSIRSATRTGPVGADAVASWCDALARRVRSGATLGDALKSVLPDDRALRQATDGARLGLERGRSIAEVMRPDAVVVAASVSAQRHLDAARSVIAVVADVGGSSAAPLDRVAAALRLRSADERERLAQGAQAKMSSKVLTIVPIAMLFVLSVSDPDVWRFTTSPLGTSCVATGLALNLLGARWMRRLIGSTP